MLAYADIHEMKLYLGLPYEYYKKINNLHVNDVIYLDICCILQSLGLKPHETPN